MVQIMHHFTVIRFICDHLWNEVYRQIELEGDTDRAERLRIAIVPLAPGTSIILACSYIERIIFELKKTTKDSGIPSPHGSIPDVGNLPEIQRYFDLNPQWEGWEELGNFYRLRHCFAHEFGRLTNRQRTNVTAFLNKLTSSQIYYKGQIVKPYFSIDNDEIIMLNGWNNRLRIVLYDFLKLFEKHGLNLEK